MLNKYTSKKSSGYFNRGRTIIELMIALALSMLLVAAITTVIVVNRSVIRTLSVDARLEQMGYNTLKLITYDLEQAGFIVRPADDNPFWNWNGGNGFSGLGAAIQPVFSNAPNSLQISQMLDQADANLHPDYIVAGTNNSQFINCQGRRFALNPAANIAARTRFFIQNNQLRCETTLLTGPAAGTAQGEAIIAENVTGLTMRYLTPTNVLTTRPTGPTAPPETTWQWRPLANMNANLWNQVVAVEVCVEITENALTSLGAQNDDNGFINCDGDADDAPDGAVSRVFRDIVPLKNVLATETN